MNRIEIPLRLPSLNNYINETSINLRKVLIDGEFKVQNNKIIFTVTDKENTEKIILNDSVFKAKNKRNIITSINFCYTNKC